MWKYTFLVGIGISLSLGFLSSNHLESLAHIATIIAAGAVIFAYLDYRNRKIKENTFSVVEQLNFFRTEILVTYDSISNVIQNEKGDVDSVKLPMPLDNFDYVTNYIKFNDIFTNQEALVTNLKLESKLLQLINQLEEFSWRVILNNTQHEPALHAVQVGFVQLVEMFASRILFSRFVDSKKFEGIYRLYNFWASKNSRETKDEIFERAKRDAKDLKAKLEANGTKITLK